MIKLKKKKNMEGSLLLFFTKLLQLNSVLTGCEGWTTH